MSHLRRLGILGGTFDPIHLGHLAAGAAARSALDLDEVLVVPAHDPPHRAAHPCASGYHRFAMAALATSGVPGFALSDLELAADQPSYTATTVTRLLDSGWQSVELFFITGSDAFAEIATWREYPALIDLCHFVVISRPSWPLNAVRTRLPELASRMRTISGNEVVAPEPVMAPGLSIILVDGQTPDVSSTEIRRRIGTGESISGLVHPAVEAHIRRHGLYRGSYQA